MNPQHFHNLPQNPRPGYIPQNIDSSTGQKSLQAINPHNQIPLKLNQYMGNPAPMQNLDQESSYQSSESVRTLPDISVPNYQQNMQFNPMRAVFPVKTDSTYQSQSSQQGSQQIPLSNQGIPMKGPSIPRIQSNSQNTQGTPLMINPRIQGNIPQNGIQIKPPQQIPNASQMNEKNQFNPEIPQNGNLMKPVKIIPNSTQIGQPNQFSNEMPQNENPVKPIKMIPNAAPQLSQPNQFINKLSPPQNLQPQFSPPSQFNTPPTEHQNSQFPINQPHSQLPNLQNPQFQFISQIPSQDPQIQTNQSNQLTPQIPGPPNLQPQQLNPNPPRTQFIPQPQNSQEIASNLPNPKFGVPSFIPQNMSPNIPPPPLHGQSPGFMNIPMKNTNPQPSADSNKFVKPPPPPPGAQVPNFSFPPMSSQDENKQIPGNSQSGVQDFPLTGVNTGPTFPQQINNAVEGSLPDINGNSPQPNPMIRPPQVNLQPPNVPNALSSNPPPLRNPSVQEPRFSPNIPHKSSSNPLNQPFNLNQYRRPEEINQPFVGLMQNSMKSEPFEEERAFPAPPNTALDIETVPCPAAIASKLNKRNAKTEIQRKYMLTSIQYNGTSFILNGVSGSVQQAAEDLRKIIAQESQLGNVNWEWLRDDGSLEAYPPALSEVIENAYNRREKEATITIRNISYKVIFGNPHVQVVPNSNISRTVRRNDGNMENIDRKIKQDEVTWYWQDDDKQFKKYTAEASRQIEAAYKQGSKALVQGSNIRGYLLDFEKMIQQNERSKFARKIRRGE